MQFREQAISMNKEIDELIMKIRLESLQTLANGIKDLYGERVTPILPDCVLLLDGMYSSYIKLLVLQGMDLNLEQLPKFIMNRMNDVVEGMLRNNADPFLPIERAQTIFHETNQSGACEQKSPWVILSDMKSSIEKMNIEDSHKRKNYSKPFNSL